MSGTALLVLGMHRSGTSALARLLALAGAALPRDLLGAGPHNSAGHWEPVAVMNFNDDILRRHNSIWHASFAPRIDWAPFLPHARAIVRDQWEGQPLILLKEPRATLLAELWMRALAEEGYACAPILMVRDPREVAASLHAAHGLDPVHAMLSWASHALAGERATAGRPHLVLRYDRLLADPADALARVEAAFGPGLLSDAAEALAGVDPALRHHDAGVENWPAGLEPVAALFRHQQALADGTPTDGIAPAAASAWLSALEPVVAPLLAEREREFRAAFTTYEARWAARLLALEVERDSLVAAALG